MDPNTYFEESSPEDPHHHTNEFTEQAAVLALIEKHAPKIEPEVWPRVLIIDDGSVDHEMLSRVRDLAMHHKIDVVMPDMPILEKVEEVSSGRRERVLLETGRGSIASVLAKILKDMPIAEPVLRPDLEPITCHVETIEAVKQAPPKAGKPSFKQFQQAKFNHGPSARRQHAHIRPPRRGGR